METDPRRWTAALRSSHDFLVAQVSALSPEQLGLGSYCRDWDVAQVLSHLGSGAEIALSALERALAGDPPVSREQFPVIWGRWNALSPIDKASQMVVWDRRLVSVLQSLEDNTLTSLRVPMFGMDLDAATMVAFRLGEHALHTWDVAVTFHPDSEVLEPASTLLVDRAPIMAGRHGKPESAKRHSRTEIRTVRPERHFQLQIADEIALGPVSDSHLQDDPADGMLELPAGALLRLLNGRLDPAHTPAGVKAHGNVDLDELRIVFPGF